jgi:hypothetical protein
MSNGWPNRDKQMRSVAEDADALARRARSVGLTTTAYILDLAVAEARKERAQVSRLQRNSRSVASGRDPEFLYLRAASEVLR